MVATAIVVVSLALSHAARADDAPTRTNRPSRRLRLELDAAYRTIFDISSSGGEASVTLLVGHGVASLLMDGRGGLGVTSAGLHTWGIAGGVGLELAFESLRIDLEGLARCLSYAPVSSVSDATACGVGARTALLVDLVRFDEGGALFVAASAEVDYFPVSLMSFSPAIGVGARF